MYDQAQQLIYVGKAKNLRRRLSQYRHAKRLKKHSKMRSIIKAAERIEHEVCATELDAFLLETRLIQAHRPRWLMLAKPSGWIHRTCALIVAWPGPTA